MFSIIYKVSSYSDCVTSHYWCLFYVMYSVCNVSNFLWLPNTGKVRANLTICGVGSNSQRKTFNLTAYIWTKLVLFVVTPVVILWTLLSSTWPWGWEPIGSLYFVCPPGSRCWVQSHWLPGDGIHHKDNRWLWIKGCLDLAALGGIKINIKLSGLHFFLEIWSWQYWKSCLYLNILMNIQMKVFDYISLIWFWKTLKKSCTLPHSDLLPILNIWHGLELSWRK